MSWDSSLREEICELFEETAPATLDRHSARESFRFFRGFRPPTPFSTAFRLHGSSTANPHAELHERTCIECGAAFEHHMIQIKYCGFSCAKARQTRSDRINLRDKRARKKALKQQRGE